MTITNRQITNHRSLFTNHYSPITNHGFTLIELLIVIMIMALIFGLGFANYRGFQRRQTLESAARIIQSDLRFAQEQALAGKRPAGCTSLDAYIVRYVSSSSYAIRARCLPGPIFTPDLKTVNFSASYPDITILPFPDVVFNILGRGVFNQVTINLVQLGNPTPKQIIITKGGEIR